MLRDYDDRIERSKIEMMIQKDIDQIWGEIYKPEQHANSVAKDFFQFEFVMMPHKIFREEDFFATGRELKARFDKNAENTLFDSTTDDGLKVPIDGMPIYVGQTWSVIKDEKELNIPGQKEMVANFRCNELKDETLMRVKP